MKGRLVLAAAGLALCARRLLSMRGMPQGAAYSTGVYATPLPLMRISLTRVQTCTSLRAPSKFPPHF